MSKHHARVAVRCWSDERKETYSPKWSADPLDQSIRSPEKREPATRSRNAPSCRPTRRATHHTKEKPGASGSDSPHRTSWWKDRDGHHGFHWHRAGRTRGAREGDAESLRCGGYGEGGTDRNSGRPARGRRPHPGSRRFSTCICWRVTGQEHNQPPLAWFHVRGKSRTLALYEALRSIDFIYCSRYRLHHQQTVLTRYPSLKGYHHEERRDDGRRDNVDD
jgi:hypothetical protein